MKKQRSLKWSMLSMLGVGWLLPLLLIAVVITGQVYRSLNEQIKRTITITTEKAVEICTLRLSDCITQSKDISYNGQLRSIYEQYLRDGNEADLYSSTTSLLEEKYKFNEDYRLTGLYYTDMPDRFYFTGSTYLAGSQRFFSTYGKQAVRNASETIDTDTVLVKAENRIYLVRNVMDHSFHPYAVLFMELNDTRIFESLQSVWQCTGFEVFCGEKLLFDENGPDTAVAEAGALTDKEIRFLGDDIVLHRMDLGSNRMTYAVRYDREAVKQEVRAPADLFGLMLVFMIPLIVLLIHFFNRRISVPVEELAAASEEITKGNYGITVPVHKENGELTNLDQNFNEMSMKLKDQFEKIYLEEIALRDANIHALQSQINPHFLNNTLEIINWEARMGGNEKVAEMIEALSVMMGATLNREKRDIIPLREELEYVKAYLFIIKCRYGDSFSCKTEVRNPEALDYMVPRLIIQPIIENAVEHGRNSSNDGFVSLVIEGGKHANDDLRIIVTNQGEPSEESMKKIHALLNDSAEEQVHASQIGIRNVNRRLKMLYSDASGLTIEPDGHGNTISTIIVKKSQAQQFKL